MHEMALAEGVRDIVDAAARSEGIDRFTAIVLEIGALAAVEIQALRFGLDVVLKGSPAADAVVRVERIEGRGWCLACDGSTPINALSDPCRHCGSYRVQPVEGTELRVKELLF